MAKSMRSKREKRLRAIRRDLVQPLCDKKDEAKLAVLEAALAAPKLPVKPSPFASTSSSAAMDTTTTTTTIETQMDMEMDDDKQTKRSLKPTGKKLKKKLKMLAKFCVFDAAVIHYDYRVFEILLSFGRSEPPYLYAAGELCSLVCLESLDFLGFNCPNHPRMKARIIGDGQC
ncbi:hypothetical protein SADUNF_Sadunf03G0118500 [Salix dunnii]|uniref:Uncharacterized protein n=1 Tax=Salix dunnii TaxID=1413687 RepID=A0A835TEF4_9ROSI|nr:hypothetical protein SADUNF_Sadunf03G0118500 [Salix dunnii]